MLNRHRSFFSLQPVNKKLERTLYEERQQTRDIIERLDIPQNTIAEIGGIFRSEVSRYVRGRAVSRRDCVLIEKTAAEIADLLSFMQEHVGLRPDLRDIESLRNSVIELRTARAQVLNDTDQKLAIAAAEATAAIQELC